MKSLCLIILLALIPLSVQALELGERDNGRSISVPLAEKLTITLPGNPTTGYRWELAAVNRRVLAAEADAGFVSDSDRVGAGGKFRFSFTAVQPGKSALKLVYRRPWEKGVAPVQTFNLTVNVSSVGQQNSARYRSGDGKLLKAVFDLKQNQVLLTLPDGRKLTLPAAMSGSGARYSNGAESFWEHQGVGRYFKGDLLLFEGRALNDGNGKTSR